MRRVVIDTSVYIDWFNHGRHEEFLFERGAVKYLSAVVMMELRAGAFSLGDRRLLLRVESAFERAGRVLVPTKAVFADAGTVLRRLQSERGYNLKGNHSIVNDVLIALSARSIGAAVVTRNASDFQAIHTMRPFQLRLPASGADQ
jgi:predicted nucleic acid-binding protein